MHTDQKEAYPLPAERLEHGLGDVHPPFNASQALTEANRCLYCYDAPCVTACPTAIDIPEFIRRIATGATKASARTILKSNILGLSCASVCPTEVLCAGACVYNLEEKPPIDIGRLQRFATDHVYDRGIQLFEAGPRNGRRIACVGGGPGSLAAAHELSLLGYDVTIFEANALPGGLNTTGVAPYKMKAEDALREVRYILEVGGIELRTNHPIGPDDLAQLEREYEAVFIGVGLGADGRLGVPREGVPGVIGAVELIERIKNRPAAELAWLREVKRALVVGGGNTSIDIVRQLCRLDVPEVTLVYRRTEADMPAYDHEVAGARQEGARFAFERQPLGVEVDADGRASGLRVVRTRPTAPDASGRAGREPVPGAEEVLPGDLIVAAIGQERLEALIGGVEGLALERGRLPIDPETGQTRNPRYFSGGDCANGGKEVVNAAAEGKRAARGIDRWVRSRQEEQA